MGGEPRARSLAEEWRLAAEERAVAERQLAAEERAAMRPVRRPTIEEFLVSAGHGYLVPGRESGAESAAENDAIFDGPSAWLPGVSDE